ncbi:hypothetical protein [Candidatus Pelagibacter sp.]|uniref:hypothetical protein n=1 Tax=Candidatus Pelagibacter sp. TaxID=2024849 RepID=UPI003F86D45A
MKISKLLNKKNSIFLILFFLFSFNLYAQDEPVDIWNIDKSKTDEQAITEEKVETIESNEEITGQQTIDTEDLKIESEILLDQKLESKDIKILGLYDPSENGLSMQMWRNSNGSELKNIFTSLDKINLSKDANKIIEISLLTNANYPSKDISFEEFSNIKSNWLIKNSNLDLIEEYLISNELLNENPELVNHLINEHLSKSNLEKACQIFEKSKSSPEDEYLFKFKLYCLIDSDEKEQAQLIYDLRKELGFEDKYFEEKINYLLGLTEEMPEEISENSILDFHLAHRINPNFAFEPNQNTSKIIWSYLSSSNLLFKADQIDISDLEKISVIENATHDQNYSENELYEIYKKFQFNINQLLTIKDSYKLLPKSEGRALVYQGILLTTDVQKKLELMKILKDSFLEENIGNAFDSELDKFLANIEIEDVPSNFTTFYSANTNKTVASENSEIKFNNKILHQSKLVNYFDNGYKLKEIEKEVENFLKKIKKNKKYFLSKKDIIFIEALKSDGIKVSEKYDDLYKIDDDKEIPTDIQNMIIKEDIGGALLRIAQVIGQDNIEEIDDDTIYFIISTLNKLDIDPIRNRMLLKVLPLKV